MRCDKHNKHMECMAGCSAHHSNWYCTECDKEQRIKALEAELAAFKQGIDGQTPLYLEALKKVEELEAELKESNEAAELFYNDFNEAAHKLKKLEAELIRLTECEELYRRVAEGLITELREGEK